MARDAALPPDHRDGRRRAAWLVTADTDWFYVFVPQGLAGGRDPAATTDYLRRTLSHQASLGSYGQLAAMLVTHNAQIAIAAFRPGLPVLPADGRAAGL